MKSVLIALAAGMVACPAFAQGEPPPPITVSGAVGLVSDYRFRGVSRSDEGVAVQGGVTARHESGLHIGAWASSLAGWGRSGGADAELDLTGGYRADVGGGRTIDLGITWYLYPGGSGKTDFAEVYLKLSGTVGPVNYTVGGAYAPRQSALGDWSSTGAAAAAGIYDRPGAKGDNLSIYGDLDTALPGTPVTLRAHVGYSTGNRGLGPTGVSLAPTGAYLDYAIGADIVAGPLIFGLSYVDTDITRREAAYLLPGFSKKGRGGAIADGRFVLSTTATF